MQSLVITLLLGTCLTVCHAQTDTTHRAVPSGASPTKPVLIPGVDAPVSAPGTLMQSSPQPNVLPPSDSKRRTNPPADPRAFGVGIPIGNGKARKDSV